MDSFETSSFKFNSIRFNSLIFFVHPDFEMRAILVYLCFDTGVSPKRCLGASSGLHLILYFSGSICDEVSFEGQMAKRMNPSDQHAIFSY